MTITFTPAPRSDAAAIFAPTRLHHFFENTADARPMAVALECDGLHLTYAELDRRANRLAHHLLAEHLQPGARVGVLIPRSVDMYVAILATLKVEATFVPLDPATPADRAAFVAQDAGLDTILTTSSFVDICAGLTTSVVFLDTLAEVIAAAPSHRPDLETTGDPACYIIYTSGSSGRPKGVEVAQSSICSYFRFIGDIYGIRPTDRVYQGLTIAFDFAIEEIWDTWVAGATLVAGPTDGRAVGPGLAEFLEDAHITVFHCVPTVLATLDRPIPSVTTVVAGGEACAPELVERWAPGRRMLNTYGPTETTITCLWTELEPGKPVTIGKPLPTYTASLLDQNLQPVPDGEIGEICIGGPGVARGYVNRPELTAQLFIPDPFSENGDRLYRTGDLGRQLPDGDIEYHGRADDQVKVRGHRIDLQEIESVLLEDERVSAAVVNVISTPEIGAELAAYVVLKDGIIFNGELAAALHTQARHRMPAYMVPSYLEPIDAVPMLPSGKVDRKSLPGPQRPRLVGGTGTHVAAETPTEQLMAELWEAVLGLAPGSASVDANFFEDLGGHSLLAAAVVSRLRSEHAAGGLSILDLYQHPTIRDLARHQDELAAQAPDPTGSIADRPRVGGGRVAAFGLAQLGWIYSLLVTLLLPVGVIYSINGGQPSFTVLWQLLLAFPLSYLFGRWVLPLIGVRALTSGLEPGTYPLWGRVHLRVWAAEKLMTFAPLGVLSGSPWAESYLRLAGAEVGEGCHIGTAEIPLPTLVTLEDGATIGYATHLRTSEIADGVLSLGRVTIGRDAVVNANCVLDGPCRVGAGAVLYDQSLVKAGEQIPDGESWVGSPATPREDGGDPVSELMAACPNAPRTWPRELLPWFAVGVAFLEFLPILALVPLVALVWWTLLTQGALLALLVTAASGPLFVLSTCGLVLAARRLALPDTPVGVHHLRSTIGMNKWFGDKLLDQSLLLTNTLYSTLYTPIWLRALGADVGRGAEVSTISNIDPDLLTLGAGSFVADMASVGSATYGNGHVAFRRTEIGSRTFVGNASFIPSGSDLGDESLVGVLTTPPVTGVAPGTSWLGSPPFYLPKREMYEEFTEAQTFRPSRRRVVMRYLIEFFRIVLPSSILALATFATLYTLSFVAVALPLWGVVLATPVLALLASLSVVLLVAAAKWTIIGRYRPRVEPLWSGFVRRTEFVTGLYEAAAVPALLTALTGTPLLGPLLRLFGTHVGRRTLLDTTYLSEFDLVHIGDDVAIGHAASLQSHLFEDRVMKMSTIHLGARSSIGTRAIVLYDTVVGEDVSLAMLSLVMKGEHLLPATAWHGIPAQTAERRAHLEPDWTGTNEPGQPIGVQSAPVEPRYCDV